MVDDARGDGDKLVNTLHQENAALRERVADLEALAQHDPLTNIGNRRAFDIDLKKELERTRRIGYPTCLVLLDIDGLKDINDSRGHPAGDACLVYLALVLAEKVRKLDSVHRIGGDEFAIVLSASTAEAGSAVAQRIQSAPLAINHRGQELMFRISIGVASADGGGITVLDPSLVSVRRSHIEVKLDQLPATLLASADEVLYQNKALNRFNA